MEALLPSVQKLSAGDLKALMGVSDPLAKLNQHRFATFAAQPQKQAVLAFDGQAYKGLDAKSLSEADLLFAQGHLRILSGLYGLVRPLDLVRPYRLEFGTKLRNPRGANLYEFWGSTVTDLLNADLAELPAPQRLVVNVASAEYFKAVKPAALAAPLLTVAFPGPAVHAKEARGAIVRYAVVNRLTEPQGLKAFAGTKGEWRFDPAASTEAVYTFVRGAPQRAAAGGKAAAAGAAGAAAGAGSGSKKRGARGGGKAQEADEAVEGAEAELQNS